MKSRPVRQALGLAKNAGTAFMIALGLTASAPGAMLRAGVAKVDITPPPGLPMYGYFDRIKNNQLATGTLDPLEARALVLEAGDRRAALVTLDLGRTFGAGSLAGLRQGTREPSGNPEVIGTGSHTP